MMKKILIISISVILIGAIAFSVWYLFKREPVAPKTLVPNENGLPFGSGSSLGLEENIVPTTNNQEESAVGDDVTAIDEYGSPTSKLFRISQSPIAGFLAFNKNGGLAVRYVDRATGHIYDASISNSTSTSLIETVKITNNTLPKVYEAYFKPDGGSVLLRLLRDNSDVIENISISLTPPKASSEETLYTASSTALRGEIKYVSVNSNSLFFVLKDNLSIVSSAFNGSGVKTLLTSAFTDWRISPYGNNLLVSTKAGASVSGYTYTLSASGGSLTKILGPLNGLVTISDISGSKTAYSYVDGGAIRLFIREMKSGGKVSELSPGTFADKCVFGTKNNLLCGVPNGQLSNTDLDNWYLGKKQFSDLIWIFNTETGSARILSEPEKELEMGLDVYKSELAPKEDYLFFINKTDMSLWALKLE